MIECNRSAFMDQCLGPRVRDFMEIWNDSRPSFAAWCRDWVLEPCWSATVERRGSVVQVGASSSKQRPRIGTQVRALPGPR